MTFNNKLLEYAKLTVQKGGNVAKGKYVLLSCPVHAAEFGRMVAKEAYNCGAKDVIMMYYDEKFSRLRLDSADMDMFDTVPEWQAEQRNYYARKGCVAITIISEDPDIFSGADGKKLMANTVAKKNAFKEFYDIMDKGDLRWTIVAYPCNEWAKRVFPNQPCDIATDKLWEAIFKSVRIGEGNTSEEWEKHDAVLKRRAEALNSESFALLEYKSGIGTDFRVGLANNHIWCGGSEKSNDGIAYFPNMPTEEIFTMPDRTVADGTVVASMPLSYQGALIENFSLTFRNGEVTECHAEKGEEHLIRLLDTDKGSRRLGEVALIPYDSPISNQKILFYNTLFDENASCHLALGECYPNTMLGGEKLTEEELLKCGGNRSANHVDFMIGTPDMSITGIRKDGTRVPVFKNGNFVI